MTRWFEWVGIATAFMAGSPVRAANPDGDFHVSVSAGGGFAYDGAGLRVDLRWDRFGVFGATGPLGMRSRSSDVYGVHERPFLGSFAAGIRWNVSEPGAGLVASLYVMRTESRVTRPWAAGSPLERSIHAALTVGWRWRLGPMFIEAGAGPVLHRDRRFFATEPGDPQGPTDTTNFGLFYDAARSSSGWWFVPTADLGVGYEF